MSERDDSFFAPPRATSASHDARAQMQAQSRMRARQMFGLPSDPTSHHPSSEFDDYGSFDQSYAAAAASYEIGDEELVEEEEGIMDEDDDDQDERDAENELDGMAGYEHGHEGEGEEQADNTYLESDASSAAFDPDEDPEAWAERLDELAGTLEMSEAEARALRWGPAIGRERDAPDLHIDDFRKLLNHHLTATDWKFHPSDRTVPLAPGMTPNPEYHPIRVLGHNWIGREAGQRLDPLMGLRQTALENGFGAAM